MTYTFRPAIRVDTPLIIGLAGPSKSGKTYSALRLAKGLAGERPIFMLNTEGPRGHSYADKFSYMAADITDTFPATKFTEALKDAAKESPGVVIIDSATHMHDGPGGTLMWHEAVLDRIAGKDYAKRDRSTYTAWVEPKQALTEFIYQMTSMKCPVILCMRAKEKLKIVRGKEPEPLGWQPIIGEELSFETQFTLTLPPFSKGAPDLKLSSMREPFDSIIESGRPIDEDLGRRLAEWARGDSSQPAGSAPEPASAALLDSFKDKLANELNISEGSALEFAQWESFDGKTGRELKGLLDGLRDSKKPQESLL